MTLPVGRREPVFVVGASRSGTALMRSLLNQHPQIHLAGETHYFDDLRPRVAGLIGRRLDPASARRCEDYFLALGHRPYSHGGDPEKGRVARSDLQERAAAIGGGPDAYFEAYCRLEAELCGSPVWGEKTPRHVFRIAQILEQFPGARVIAMVRDPRAVVASYRDWDSKGGFDFEADPGHREQVARDLERAHRSYHIVIQTLLWRGAVSAALGARARFGAERVRLQRYEDVVDAPESTAREIARFLGVPYEPAMLDVPVHNSSHEAFDPKGGIVRSARERWRSQLSPAEIAVIQLHARSAMGSVGYELADAPFAPLALLREHCTLPLALLRAVRANRERLGSVPAYVLRRLRFAAGIR